ncbi:outer membrane protein assembly protein AsmA [Psychromonas sp. CNPT3]|uniref:AsmA family protein n=1 Tax=Psychromonas sp. CNPT3 TaxID=314282 RepID=UPI00006E615B|nr:AsmA family protein [Psychromonas sp. CNPT3]AGH81733.1 outer membrane protein assembly protein AsmA [Psychromonas sp. CNPT3]
MKLLLKIFISFIVLILLAMLALVMLVNPNDYKEQIQTQAKQSLNRELLINGDLSWTLFPQLGLSSGEIEVRNLDGFNRENFLKIESASLGIKILPLLKGQLKIAELNLEGFRLNIITNKYGQSNLDNLGPQNSIEEQPESNTKQSTEVVTNNDNKEAFFDISQLVLDGININNTVLEIQDLKANSYHKVIINKMHLGQFEFSKDSDFVLISELLVNGTKANIKLTSVINVSADLTQINLNNLVLESQFSGKDIPNGAVNSTLKTNVVYQVKSKKLTLEQFQFAVDDITLNGKISLQSGDITKVRYSLVGNQWDLNPYLPKNSTTTDKNIKNDSKVTKKVEKNTAEVEPDLSFLQGLDVQGDLKIAGILYENIKIGTITNNLIIKKGKASLSPLNVQLYGGQLNLNASVADAKGKNRYYVNTQLKDVQLRPLLIDAAQIKFLSGHTAFSFKGKGQGLTQSKIKKGLSGQGSFTLLDGELYGVNLHQDIRRLKATLKGKKPPTESDVKKTDFASLAGSFSLHKGVVNNQKLLMLSSVLRLDGTGIINIISNTLDYKLSLAPLSKRGVETEQFDLNGVVIPLHIQGSLNDPKFSLDTKGAFKAQAKAKIDAEKKRLQRKVEKKLKGRLDDKSKQLLDGIFKGLFR